MTSIPGKLRRLIHERDGGRCQRCTRIIGSGPRSLHHRRPRGMGGSRYANTAANLILLCGSGVTGCHGWVESNRFRAKQLRFLIPQGHDPARTPLYRFMRSWEQPTDTGWVPVDPPEDFETSNEGSAA